MAEYVDWLPLFQETAETMRTRLDSDVNANLAATDPRYVDTREGSMYHDITEVLALEFARLWDALASEVPASAFPAFAWGEYLDRHAEVFGLERKAGTKASGEITFTGDNGTFIPIGTEVGTTPIDPDVTPPTFITIEEATITSVSVDITVEATDIGEFFNVGANAVQELNTPTPGISAVNNANGIYGGTEAESDADLRARVLAAFQGSGAGTANDYKRWALTRAGVGRVYVGPIGAGTVQVVVMTSDGEPVSQAIVDDVQQYLDPVAGEGKGQAPVGSVVTVTTPSLTTVNVSATVTLVSGYSLDGTGGTIAVREGIQTALSRYMDSLEVGGTVVLNHVEAQFFTVAGVYNVAEVTLNGSASDVTIDEDPPQIAELGTVTLA
jgi:uncharacterized phage protein gp47/JayE